MSAAVMYRFQKFWTGVLIRNKLGEKKITRQNVARANRLAAQVTRAATERLKNEIVNCNK